MKNMLQKISAVCAIVFVSACAFAQRGFDTYGATKTLVVLPPILMNAGNLSPQTSGWVDVKSFDGIAKLDLLCTTNVGNSSFTYTVQGSNDGTNATTIGSASIASALTVIYTNSYYGYTTNVGAQLSATNTYNIPGSIVNPVAATVGWATPYINVNANPFTNSLSALTPAQGYTSIGLNISDAPRYLRVTFTPGGAATNGFVGALLTGHANYQSWPF